MEELSVEKLLLRSLIFQMYAAGIPQAAIGKYVGIATGSVNAILKPLPKKDKKDA